MRSDETGEDEEAFRSALRATELLAGLAESDLSSPIEALDSLQLLEVVIMLEDRGVNVTELEVGDLVTLRDLFTKWRLR